MFFIIGIFLSSLVRPTLVHFVLRQQELTTVVFANRLAAEHLFAEDFKKPADENSRVRFEAFVDGLQIPGLFRVKFWNPDGVIVYSDEPRLIGQKFSLTEGLQGALDLKSVAEIEKFKEGDPHHEYETSFVEGLEIYAPITFGASPKIIGIFEAYARTGFLNEQINELRNLFIGRIIISLTLMFLALSFIVWRASRTVARQGVKLQAYATGLERMVEDRTKKLKEASESEIKKAKELIKLKDQFVFVAAHELRTPANAIKWGLDAFKMDSPDIFEKKKSFLDIIKNSNERLLRLVTDLLEVARIEGTTITIDINKVSIPESLGEAIKETEGMAKSSGVGVVNNIPKDISYVLADPVRLKEVFINLLTNAIKYNKERGVITISSEQKDSLVIIHVADEGIGISSEDQKHVFEKFWRSESVHGIEGTGLGLFIVKQLVELMNGEIWFESKPQQGTVFSFSLKKYLGDKRNKS